MGKESLIQESVPVAFINAPERALTALRNIVRFNYEFLSQASFAEIRQGMGGPLAIMGVTYQEAQKGLTRSLRWFMNLNLILAFMNMLPIPILDGLKDSPTVQTLAGGVLSWPVSSPWLSRCSP